MSKVFWVVSTVRSVHTRLTRAQAPERARFKQFVLGGSLRLLRARPLVISELQLKQYENELKTKWEAGLIEVREDTPDGPAYKFEAKKKKRKSTPPPPPPEPEVKEEPKAEEPPMAATEPEVVEEPPVEEKVEEVEEFVPPEEPEVKRRGRKPKKG